jgi:hypothetical protein
VAALLRLVEIGCDVGGFHSFNEGNYLLIARNAAPGNLLRPTLLEGMTFLETPPLYPYLVALLSWVVAPPHLAARLISVAAGLGVVVLTWKLARRRVGEQAALLAAAIVAASPVAVMTGRNAQTDSLYLVLVLGALVLADPRREGGSGPWPIVGLLAGLALVTKLFAAVAFAGWVLGWLLVPESRPRGPGARLGGAALLAVAPAGLFYGYHLVTGAGFLLPHLGRGALTATNLPATSADTWGLFVEAFWAFSPLVSLVLLAGIAFALRRPSRERLYVALPLAALAFFYAFVHKHSYYLLGLLPFLAVLAADASELWLRPTARRLVTGAVLATAAFASLVDLTSMKLGFSEFARLGASVRASAVRPAAFALDDEVHGNAFPVVAYYAQGVPLLASDRLPAAPDGRLKTPAGTTELLFFTAPDQRESPGVEVFTRDRYGLTLFGVTLAEAHVNPNFFRQGAYVVRRTGPPWDFGFTLLRSYSALAAARLGDGLAAYRTGAGIELREGGSR